MLTLAEPARDLWDRFHREPSRTRFDDPLLARWARSRALGALSGNLPAPIPRTGGGVPLILGRSDHLLAEASIELSRRGCALVLADREGCILKAHGIEAIEDHAVRAGLAEGTRWDEATRGTNAIGTALAEDAPVVVVGRAHYDKSAHGLVCYGVPIRDAFGDLIGVLDISGPVRLADPLLGVVARSLVSAIEATLRAHALDRESSRERSALTQLLAVGNAASMVVERPGHVMLMTPECKRLLTETGARIAWGSLIDAIERGRSAADVEGVPPDLTLHGEPLYDEAGHSFAALVHVGLRPAAFARSVAIVERPREPRVHRAFSEVLGDDPVVIDARERASQFASSSLPVLLLAESGTGKEPMARAIHAASENAEGPFVSVNCGSIAPSLLESTLFGYAPGAFAGASPRGSEGKIGAAEGGTLFLDQVAEMPPALQALVLRVLEDGTFTPVGDTRERHATFRLVCATNRDMAKLVASGQFRQDLYYRIKGIELTLPPLRARTDVVSLAAELLERVAREEKIASVPELGVSARAAITERAWPGNVRELKTALRYALVMARGGGTIEAEHLPANDAPATHRTPMTGAVARRDAEADAVRRALAQSHWNLTAAARALGVSRSTLYRLMDRHGLPRRG